MTRLIAVLLTGLSIAANGCAGFDPYSPEQIHRTIRSEGVDNYIVFYRREKMKSYKSDVTAADVQRYLVRHGILPAACTQGIVLIRAMETEGGRGRAQFACN